MILLTATTMEKLGSLVRGMKSGPDTETFAWLLVFVFFILLGHVTAGTVGAVRRQRAKRRDYDLKKKNTRLTPHEREIFTALAGPPESSREFNVMTSRTSFDKAVAAWVETVRDLEGDARDIAGGCLRSIRRKLGFHEPVSKWVLSSTLEMSVNQRVTLFIDSEAPVHGSVMEVDDLDFKVLVNPGSFPSMNPEVGRDSKVKIRFWRENDAEYRGVSKVLKFERMHALIFTISHPDSLKRIQQRKFLRAKVSGLPIEFFPLKNRSELQQRTAHGETIDTTMLIGMKGVLKDISGGGACAVTDKALEEGTVGIIRLELPGAEELTPMGARVVSVAPCDGKNYRISLEFVGISEKIRELIIQFVYRHQTPRV